MTKKILFAGFVALLLSASVGAQSAVVKTAYPSISMEPFGDGTRHWYFIADPSNIVNAVPNQPKYAENEITKIADNMLLYQRNLRSNRFLSDTLICIRNYIN